MPEIDASVVIPSYNNGHLLVRCLDSLARQTHPAERFEVVVVIDGSTDGTRSMLDGLDLPSRLRVIEQPNGGRAAALNRGVEEASGTYLVVIDADIVVNPEFLASHLAAHDHGDVVLGPIPLSDLSPVSFLSDGVARWAEEHASRLRARSGRIRDTEVQGANYSIRADVYRRLGGNRADLRRAEDYQFGRKLVDAGLHIVWTDAAVAAQIYDKTVSEVCRDFYIDGQSQVRLVEEFPEMRADLALGHYRPMSLTKSLVRPLIIGRHPLGEWLVQVGERVLEVARRRGLRWRLLSACQGVLADSLYFRGVRDALGSQERFDEFVRGA